MTKKNKQKLTKIIISIIIYVISLIINKNYISEILFLISYIIVGFEILKKAFKNIIRGKIFDENFLMTVATIRCFDNC